ncbi:MAG: haloacid dehalogenase-like hydrolase [Cyanobacteria bacterium J06627_32]
MDSRRTDSLTPLHLSTPIDKAIEAVSSAGSNSFIIVDFDETLFLRNSTQEYLGSIYPQPVGKLFLSVIKKISPWRWFPEKFRDRDVSQDWFLVVASTIVFPWTPLVWRWRVRQLAQDYCNPLLAQAIDGNPNAHIVIATLGFHIIVAPLVAALPMSAVDRSGFQLIACRFWRGAVDRADGKLSMVTAALGARSIARSVVVTDSPKDTPLLTAVATPCFLTWPGASYIPAMSNIYLPLLYSEKVKHPGKDHFIRRVLMWHWSVSVIAYSALSPHPITSAIALFLLILSYWCVYEIGYQENDLVGEQLEIRPTLSENYASYKTRLNLKTPWPWCWAIAFTIPGCFLLAISRIAEPLAFKDIAINGFGSTGLWLGVTKDIGLWIIFLMAIRLSFWTYNQFDEKSRLWIYLFLQTQRLFGFSLLIATNAVGFILLMSLAIARWMQYCIYRCGGDRWQFPVDVAYLFLFTTLLSGLALSHPNPSSLWTWQTAIACGFCGLKAFRKTSKVLTNFRILGTQRKPTTSSATDQELSSRKQKHR